MFKCHKFGHPQKYCRSPQPICPTCASSLHSNCDKDPPCCPNCKGPHPASSVHCPFFALEKEIMEQCAIHKYDRREATRRAREKLAHLPLSYAAAASTPSAVASSVAHRPRALSPGLAPLLRSTVRPSVPGPGSPVSVVSVALDNCPPNSPEMVRRPARRSSPTHTTLSHAPLLVEVHAAPKGMSDFAISSASEVDGNRPCASSEPTCTVSRKRPASVSPGKHRVPLNGCESPSKGGSSRDRHCLLYTSPSPRDS